jgi:hypothetical protein
MEAYRMHKPDSQYFRTKENCRAQSRATSPPSCGNVREDNKGHSGLANNAYYDMPGYTQDELRDSEDFHMITLEDCWTGNVTKAKI